MTTLNCKCGNILRLPSILVKLELISDCGHCGKDFPKANHEAALAWAAENLTEDELKEIHK